MNMSTFKGLLKGINEVKEGKVSRSYSSVDEMFAEMDKEKADFKKNNPIGYFLYYYVYLPLYRLWKNHISNWPYDIKYFIQRGANGYDASTWWQYDSYIAKISIPMLKRLKEGSHVVHTEFLPKNHSYNDRTNEKWYELTKEDEDFCQKAWEETLDKIIQSFDFVGKLTSGDWEYYHEPEADKKEWWDEHVKKFNLRVMTKEEQQAMQEGLQLWAKYYLHLND